MQSNEADDFLQFTNFSNDTSYSPPEINVDIESGCENIKNRQRGNPLSELIYDMSNSAQEFTNKSGNMGTAADTVGKTETSGNVYGGMSFLQIEYYQKFFNVDTMMVIDRIANSIIPKRATSSYLRSTLGVNPDLYGPVWITITLIFSIAISGNIASYLQHSSTVYWRYNFHLVSYAATCIFIYVDLVPLALWALFKYSPKPINEDLENDNTIYTPGILTLMCVYGYSLAIYIPVSILWVIQISWMQWLLVITAALLSGSVLIIVLSPALRSSKFAFPLIAGILGMHFLLAAGFMLCFFHVPIDDSIDNVAVKTAIETMLTSKQQNGTH